MCTEELSIHNEVNEIKISINYEIKISIIFIMFIKSDNIIAQQAQHICTAPIQRQPASKTLGQCCTNATQMSCARSEEALGRCLFCAGEQRTSTGSVHPTYSKHEGWTSVGAKLF